MGQTLKPKSIRYFLVAYAGRHRKGQFIGSVTLATNGFLNRTNIKKRIGEDVGITEVIIINILEMSSDDYVEWTADESNQ